MRIVVTGGRDYADREHVWSVLDRIHAEVPISRIAQGGAPGADAHALAWAQARGVETRTYSALWHTHGHQAGPIRNGRMLDLERPTRVIAFPGGRGTADCVKQARRRGIPTTLASTEASGQHPAKVRPR